MAIYRFDSEDEPVQFYARNPQDIVDLIAKYYNNTVAEGNISNPQIASWAKRVPALEEITQVDLGIIRYHVGIMSLKAGDAVADADIFCERMRVVPDFEVAVSPESVGYFDEQRYTLPSMKRVNLYKFSVPGGLLSSLNFIPEDVMKGILAYDITPHLERAGNVRANIDKIRHPGWIIGGHVAQPEAKKGYN